MTEKKVIRGIGACWMLGHKKGKKQLEEMLYECPLCGFPAAFEKVQGRWKEVREGTTYFDRKEK